MRLIILLHNNLIFTRRRQSSGRIATAYMLHESLLRDFYTVTITFEFLDTVNIDLTRTTDPSTLTQATMYSAIKKRLSLSSPQPVMETASNSADQLRAQIAKAEEELKGLKEQLAALEPKETASTITEIPTPATPERFSPERRKTGAPGQALQRLESSVWKWPLREDEYERYGRQLIIPQIGITGMLFSCSCFPTDVRKGENMV